MSSDTIVISDSPTRPNVLDSSEEQEIILESSSNDIIITKFDAKGAIVEPAMKSNQMPFVCFPTVTLPLTTFPNAVNVNGSIPSIHFATLPTSLLSNVHTTAPNVILTPISTPAIKNQLILQKPSPAPGKITGAYVTMLKPVPKPDPKASNNINFVIAPMPKVTTNRLPITATTNTVQSKVSFMPMPITKPDTSVPVRRQTYNLRLNEDNDLLVCDGSPENDSMEIDDKHLLCNEVIDLDSPEKEKEPPKPERKEIFNKRGVSILKKKYPNEKKDDKSLKLNNPVSDKEQPIIVTATQPKTERRRKSNFSYRKDLDEEIIVQPVPAPKEKQDINMNDDIDLQKVLKWNNGIGSLPGSNLKFVLNEFNMIEYMPESELKKMTEKLKPKEEFQDEMRCLECGCYGLSSDFINPKFCSYDCQEANAAKSKEREKFPGRKRKKLKEESDDEEENTSNENSRDKFTYPWACTKKGFSWSKYLDHVKAKSAPVKLFKDAFPYIRNGFRPGMKLEGVDPQHPSCFCVLTVAEVIGYRMRLHFDGYSECYDFWVNADSMDIFPIGWCEKYNHILQPPNGYTMNNFNWVQYLKQTKSTAAPKTLFNNRAGNSICPNGFRVGMKLEAVDRKNTSLVCVATVRDMMDNRILVHFDSWDDIYDYWADPTSPYIHPVGWCDQYGHNLTPPNGSKKSKTEDRLTKTVADYPNPESFSWEKYLKETKSVAAPVRAFKQRPACGFKRGMRLECVDKRVPQLIRVATVDDVKEHQIRIRFDGWPDRYSYWVDDDSPDIHPVGWCQKTGHPIEPPLTPDDVYDFLECPTIGCRGQGHIKGPKFSGHNNLRHCPYTDENLELERTLPDRLLSPHSSLEAVVPVSREPKESFVKRIGRPPKNPRPEPIKQDLEEDFEVKPKKFKIKEEINPDKALGLIEDAKMAPAQKESWKKHSKFLVDFVEVDSDPRLWTRNDVADFVSALPDCVGQGDVFAREDVDGEAFLSLTQSDILNKLNFKLGPAVKVYNSILLLRQRVRSHVYS